VSDDVKKASAPAPAVGAKRQFFRDFLRRETASGKDPAELVAEVQEHDPHAGKILREMTALEKLQEAEKNLSEAQRVVRQFHTDHFIFVNGHGICVKAEGFSHRDELNKEYAVLLMRLQAAENAFQSALQNWAATK
jgi:hypothetical protein